MNKIIDPSWDYAKANTKYLTHGIHPYPAMMIPQVAKRLIEENGVGSKVGLDPFCGSGSVLLEFKLAEIRSIGVDINPLAVLISKVKTTPIEVQLLERHLSKINKEVSPLVQREHIETPDFFNINFWFKKGVIKRLAILKEAIDKIKDKDVQDFFRVCFSETVRSSSNTRGGEFKLYRIPEDKLSIHNPDPFELFRKIVKRNLNAINAFYSTISKKGSAEVTILNQDITKKTKVPEKYINLLVTSPPYGDSRTTVAYGQFSRLSLQWLGFDEELTKKMDKTMMGGTISKNLKHSLPSKTLDETVSNIAKKDEKRAREVLSFFEDFYKGTIEINRVMADKSTMCFVVGNRTVKEIKIPTDEIIAEFFKEFNFNHIKTIVRNIPSKRMPKRNSPTNKPGVLSSTMNEENIIILRR